MTSPEHSASSARARWKELCFDTDRDDTLGRFYASALGLEFKPAPDVVGEIVGEIEGKGIAMCKVPEPKSVKHRVHIDVLTDSIDKLGALGATVQLPAEESGFPFTVMQDPEGGEFCAFLRDPVPDYRFFQLVVDAGNAREIASWWAEVFGGVATSHDSLDWWGVEAIPDLPFNAITFGAVPEPKTVKNRIHWDVYADVADLEGAGARTLRPADDEIGWSVMADPENNEFCAFSPRSDR